MQDNLLRRIDKLMVGSREDLDRYESVSFDDTVRPGNEFHTDLIEHMFGDGRSYGTPLPWSSVGNHFALRPHEFTVWGGVNKHGKSMVLNQVMLGMMAEGEKVAIASLELTPVETMARMACQNVGVHRDEISELAVHEFIDAITGKLWLYKETGNMHPNRALAFCRYARAELGVDHVVLDSLMKCGTTEGKADQEKSFVDSLQNIAKQTGVHIHLVAHMRKRENESVRYGKMDFHGSAHITNMPDNIIVISRNKNKESEARKLNPKQSVMEEPDTWLSVEGQRHGMGWEGSIALWFHKSGQYTGTGGHRRVILSAPKINESSSTP